MLCCILAPRHHEAQQDPSQAGNVFSSSLDETNQTVAISQHGESHRENSQSSTHIGDISRCYKSASRRTDWGLYAKVGRVAANSSADVVGTGLILEFGSTAVGLGSQAGRYGEICVGYVLELDSFRGESM